MTWPPDIADELPTPRDDEPASLRQDIADELADHLLSAFTRELHFTPEEPKARENVLDRFGDPRRIARQLWFDALKEKIMSQRFQLVLSSLMTIACLGAFAMMAFMLRDSREVNATLLEKLASLAARQPVVQSAPPAEEAPRSMDWVRAKFKLSLGEKGGPPAAGFRLQVNGALGETEKNGNVTYGVVEETAGPDGIVDLGFFRYGSYSISVSAPWGEYLSRQLALRPGQPPVREIICPAAAPEEADVKFHVQWPDDLKEERLWLICHVSAAQRRLGFDSWTISQPFAKVQGGNVLNAGAMGGMGYGMGMMGGGGGGVANSTALILNGDGKVSVRQVVQSGTGAGQNEDGSIRLGWARWMNQSQFDDSVRLTAAVTRLLTIAAVKADNNSGSQNFPILAHYPQVGMGAMGGGGMGGMGGGFFNVTDDGLPAPQRPSIPFSFTPVPGQPNEWTITLSDYFLDQIRASLKEPPRPTANQEEPVEED